ncbi:NAD(P)-dependent dehydrogenase (short-subunit alcohol dehydrogenase family) [Rhodococcus sp. AG1013]|nr:SDR family oxidoreductase [Rhodococcus sp. AG1013]RDI35575.1 NAD(P)-dependent dehydrogenase (short-subunit alcohol dehydrogenase family) [Rhodococcus sp. AG1013]
MTRVAGRMTGKVAVVTGAGNGTGRVHVRRLADEGADVVALDLPGTLSEQALAETAASVPAGRRVLTRTADVRDVAALRAAADAAAAEFGRVDVVVANAGLCDAPGPALTIDELTWQRSLDINLSGVWNTVRAFVPHMPDGGSVVVVGSTAGIRGNANRAHYAAAKHGAVGLARTLAIELGPRSIRVNSVHPGAVGSGRPLAAEAIARLRPDLAAPTEADARQALSDRNLIPVPWVDAVDVSNAVLFLACDESRFVTGTELVVDAGLTQKV